jgi:hypothetical protein
LKSIAKRWHYYIIAVVLATFSLPLSNVFSQDDTDSKNDESSPTQEHSSPTQEHSSPTQEHSSPTQEHSSPTQEHALPLHENNHDYDHAVPAYIPPQEYTPPQAYTPPSGGSSTSPQQYTPPQYKGKFGHTAPSFGNTQSASAAMSQKPVVQRHLVVDRFVFILPHHNTYFVFYVPSFANNARLTGHYSVSGSFQHVRMYVVDSTACPSYFPDSSTCSQYVIREDKPSDYNISINLDPGEKYYVGFDNPAFSTSEQVQANFVLEYQ